MPRKVRLAGGDDDGHGVMYGSKSAPALPGALPTVDGAPPPLANAGSRRGPRKAGSSMMKRRADETTRAKLRHEASSLNFHAMLYVQARRALFSHARPAGDATITPGSWCQNV